MNMHPEREKNEKGVNAMNESNPFESVLVTPRTTSTSPTSDLSTTSFTQRTTNPYKTDGPAEKNDGRSWHEYFVDLRQEREATQAIKDVDPAPQVIEWARNATDQEMASCGPVLALRKLCEEFDWETKVGYSKALQPGTEIKSGDDEGEMRPDSIIEQLWILARKQGRGTIKVTYTRKNEGKWARDIGYIRGVYLKMSDKDMKEYIRE